MAISGIGQGISGNFSHFQPSQPRTQSHETAVSQTSSFSTALAQAGVVVTLSDEGQRTAQAHSLPAWVESWSTSLRNRPDQQQAAREVETFAKIPDDELVSLVEGKDGVTRVYYASTGLPVTAESTAYFKELRQSIHSERTRIYNEEVAKGAAPADIFDTLVQYMRTQPKEYLHMMNFY